jgi:hypothetical protein
MSVGVATAEVIVGGQSQGGEVGVAPVRCPLSVIPLTILPCPVEWCWLASLIPSKAHAMDW